MVYSLVLPLSQSRLRLQKLSPKASRLSPLPIASHPLSSMGPATICHPPSLSPPTPPAQHLLTAAARPPSSPASLGGRPNGGGRALLGATAAAEASLEEEAAAVAGVPSLGASSERQRDPARPSPRAVAQLPVPQLPSAGVASLGASSERWRGPARPVSSHRAGTGAATAAARARAVVGESWSIRSAWSGRGSLSAAATSASMCEGRTLQRRARRRRARAGRRSGERGH